SIILRSTMPNNKINFNKKIINELIESTIKSTPGINEWNVISIENNNEKSDLIEINMSISVNDEINQKSNVIDEFEDFLKEKLNSILDINKNNIVLKIELI
ncbi:MAG: hypothetical protein K2L64_02230, partial [Ureaplasma sp.]|nr:hypothetical protein [Ureaplasma sp.]